MKIKELVDKMSEDKQTIVMISGKKGTGKTHLATAISNHIKETYNETQGIYKYKLDDFLKYLGYVALESFAKPIKSVVEYLELETELAVRDYKESVYRKIMQTIGQQFRNVDKDIWIKMLVARVETYMSKVILIDDCRFINELNAFDGMDEYDVIKIRMATKSVYDGNDNDISETELDDLDDSEFDFIVRDWNYNE